MDEILISQEVLNKLKVEVPRSKVDINIISAFCKLSTLEFIDSLCHSNIKKKLLVRFLPSDLASGATDKEIYNFCKSHSWEIYIDSSLHAKTYIFDKYRCISGSANATNKGLGSASNANKELSTYFILDKEQYKKVMTLYNDAVFLDDELYQFIQSQSDNEVIKYLSKKPRIKENIECLLPEDFPTGDIDMADLHKLRSYKFLVQFLESKDNHSASFGEISSKIHDYFIKDPKPYRKDIKEYLSNLIVAIKNNGDSRVKVTRPNYSELLSLNDNH